MWAHDETLLASYVMMMPAARGNDTWSATQVTDRAYDGQTFTESDVATTTFGPSDISTRKYRGNEFSLYGTTSGVSIDSFCDIVDRDNGSFAYLSNAAQYNKWYCSYCSYGLPEDQQAQTYAVHTGDVWEWTSRYKIRHSDI